MQDAEVSRGPIIKNPYLSIFKAIPLPAILIRANAPDFTVKNANDAYTELSGKPREELVGKNLFELFPDNPNDSASDSVKRMTTQLRAVIETGQESSKNVERYDIEVGDTGNFEERYYNYTLTPFSGENGETEYILQVVEEVTDKVLLDREHNLLFNESEASFVLVGRDKKIVNFNREFELLYKSLTGKLPEKNSPAVDLVQSERHDKVEQVFERTLRGETTIYELEFPVESGNSRYFKIKYKPAIDSEGNIFGVVVTHKEITNERAAVKKLEENEARFRALVEQGNDVLFVLSPEGTPTYISPSIENVLGYTAEEAKRIDIFSSVHPDDIPHVQTELGKCLEQPGVPIQVTPARMKHKDGSWRWFDGTITNMLHDPAINGIVDNFHEITHRVEMEEKLNQARKRYKSIIQSIDGVFWEAKADTFEFTFVSPQAKEMLGYSSEEWLSEPNFWKNRIHPDDRETAVAYCHRETQNGRNHEFEYRFIKADGSYIWLKDIVSVIEYNGVPKLLRGLLVDITEKIEREQQLNRTVERYEIVSKATSDTIWDFDLSDDKMLFNNNIHTMFGYKPEEVSGVASWWRNKIHPGDQLHVSQALRNAISFKEDRFQMEYRFRCADGTYKNIYDRAFLIKDETDEPVRIIGAMQDITNMVEEQEQMKLLQSVVTNTNESVIISEANPDSRPGRNIVYVNNAFTAMTGYTADETISHSTDFLIGATTNSEKRQEFLSVLKKGRISEMENIYYRKDGGKIWVHTSGVPVENRSGVCTHWVFISRDITDQKAQEEKILSSLKEKETLLAEIHHRVKNNLAVVSSLMELQSMNSENNELQSQLMSSVLRIKSMATVHEQLYQSNSFSKLQFSKGLKQLIQSVIETLQTNTKIDLEFVLDNVELSINQGIPCSLLMNEIVTNILKHGFGNRKTGQISVELRQTGDMIMVEVKDDGCGLPDDFGVSESSSMGIQLIELLTQQLKGEKNFHSDKSGTTFTLRFSKHEGKGIGSSFVQ